LAEHSQSDAPFAGHDGGGYHRALLARDDSLPGPKRVVSTFSVTVTLVPAEA
jgi:hypothetical protein